MAAKLIKTIRQEEQDQTIFCDCCGKEESRLFVIKDDGVLDEMILCLNSFLKEVERGAI